MRAVKAENKGRLWLLGIEVPMREAINRKLFPVRTRLSGGHSVRLPGDPKTDCSRVMPQKRALQVEFRVAGFRCKPQPGPDA